MASQSWIDKDFYAILGVPKTASAADIKKAYRTAAKTYHPDRDASPESEDKFKSIGEAYSVLSDATKRAEYDKLRDAIASGYGPSRGGMPGGGFRVEDFGFGEEFDVEELLRQMFGGAGGGKVNFRVGGSPFGGFGRQQMPQRGRDVETQMDLTFEEAVEGTERTLRLRLPDGPREVKVRIPAGVNDGARIRVRGRGESGGPGAETGDLFVIAKVQPHKFFTRKGNDLTLNLPITFAEAALGADVKVPTLNGPVTLKVPAGTSSGKTFRLRGRGIELSGGTKGDILATVQVAVPEKVSKKKQELIVQLADGEESPRKHLEV